MWNRRATVAAVTVLLAGGLAWAAQGRTLKVTVNYTGSGEVSATNAVYLAAWTTPDFGGGTSAPIAAAVAQENGATVSFDNLTASPVYVTALYVQGGWDQVSTPPSGSPAGAYSSDAAGAPGAIEVAAGETVEVELTFNDAFRLP